MAAQFNYTMFQYRSAELRRGGDGARHATEMAAKRRRLRHQNLITRPGAKPWRGAPALDVYRTTGGAR
jgi:hypothetical protein